MYKVKLTSPEELELVKKKFEELGNVASVARFFSVGQNTIKTRLNSIGIETPKGKPEKIEFSFVTKEFLEKEYTNKQKTARAISKEFNVPTGIVLRRLKKYNIAILKDSQRRPEMKKIISLETRRKIGNSQRGRKHNENQKQALLKANLGRKMLDSTKQKIQEKHFNYDNLQKFYETDLELIKQKFEEYKSVQAVADFFSVSFGVVKKTLTDLGLKDQITFGVPLKKEYEFLTKEFLEEQYSVKLKTVDEIAQEFGASRSAVGARIKKHGIPIINRADRPSTVEKLRNNQLGKKASEETRKKQSNMRKGRKLSERQRQILLNANIGRIVSEETKEKIRKGNIEFYSNWENIQKLYNLTDFTKEKYDDFRALYKAVRSCSKYWRWRERVVERDGHKCTECGCTENLEVDHIKPFALILKELRNEREKIYDSNCVLWDISNGRTLCEPCHFKTDSYGRNSCNYSAAEPQSP